MLESTSCGSNGGWNSNIFDTIGLLQNNYTKDYALLQVDEDPFSTYGSLELEDRLPDDGEVIYIPQHAGLRDKELAIFDTDSSDPDGRCSVNSTSTRSCEKYGKTLKDVSYTCDTEGGSSGAPVISAETGKVIALHHCGGGCNGNVGVPITQIYNEISSLVYPENDNSGSNGDPDCKCILKILKKGGIAYASNVWLTSFANFLEAPTTVKGDPHCKSINQGLLFAMSSFIDTCICLNFFLYKFVLSRVNTLNTMVSVIWSLRRIPTLLMV
jgi:hypothetical protein